MHDAARASECWNPARDWPAVWGLVDRWPGLRSEHDETWLVLCKLCPPGRRGLRLDIDALRASLQGVRGGRHVHEGQVTRRLKRLALVGLIHWRRGRPGELVIGLHDPRRIEPEPIAGSGPVPASTTTPPTSERQGTLWKETPALRLFDPQTACGVCHESASACASDPEALSACGQKRSALVAGSASASTSEVSPPPGEPAGETPRAGAPAPFIHSSPSKNDGDGMDGDGIDGTASASSSAAGAIERARAALRRLLGEAAAGAMADGHLPDLVRICLAVEGRAGVEAEDLADAVERAVKKPRADRLRYLRGVVRGRLAQRAGLPASSWLEYERVVTALRLPEDWLARVMGAGGSGLGAERGSGGAKERGTGGCTRPTPEEAAEIRSMLAEAREAMRRARADAGERQRGEGGGGT